MNSILKKITLLLAASALLTGFTSCAEEDADMVSSSQDNIVLEQDVYHANFEIRANTAWTAECITFDDNNNPTQENWFRITPTEGMGTTRVTLDVNESNHSIKARSGQIKVTYPNGKSHLIAVSQRGLTDIATTVTPQQIGVGAKVSTGNLFTVSVANRDAEITTKVISGNDWLTNLTMAYDLKFGYSRKEAWTFDAAENQNSDVRKAEIKVTITFGYNTYDHIVTVTQSGLGAPAVMTAPTVYMNNAQTSHTQTIWTEGGDKTNVNFTTTWTSAYDGVDNAAGWITDATIIGHDLVITTEKNLDAAAREGVVTIVASRSAHIGESAYATQTVKVSQAGYQSAGIVVPVAEVAYYAEEKACTQYITLLNKSTVKSISNDNSAMFKVAPEIATGTSQLTYTLNAYNGAEGDYREAVITIVVSNSGANDAIASLKVRQYAPQMPAISSLMEYIGLGSAASGDQSLLLAVQNGATLTASSSAAWLTAAMDAADKSKLTYSTTEFTGGSAPDFCREAVITIKATNTHKNPAYYYITVRQYGIQGASLTTFGTLPDWAGGPVHYKLINGENVTSMHIDAAHGASKYSVDGLPNPISGSTPSFLTFNEITPTSFHMSWTANNLPMEGGHSNIWRSQQIIFNLTLANQRNQVLTATIAQQHR